MRIGEGERIVFIIVILQLVIIVMLFHINEKLPHKTTRDFVTEAMERDRKAREEKEARDKR